MTIDVDEWLKEEYFHLQKTVEEFDGRTLTIKAWSVTFSATGLALAYQQRVPILLLVAAGSAIVFWLIEMLWKLYQRAFYARLSEIELYLRNPVNRTIVPLQIRHSWHASFWGTPPREAAGAENRADANDTAAPQGPRKRLWLRVALFPGVMLPHVLVAAAGGALWFFCPPAPPAEPAKLELKIR
jgi:hypothetical protein